MLRYPPTRMSNILPEVVRLLSEWGAKVDVIYPEQQLVDLSKVRVEHDLYILKAKTELALSLAGVLHAAGAAILNPYPVSMTLHDKIMTFHVLQAAGLPTPETYVASHPDQLTSRCALQPGTSFRPALLRAARARPQDLLHRRPNLRRETCLAGSHLRREARRTLHDNSRAAQHLFTLRPCFRHRPLWAGHH